VLSSKAPLEPYIEVLVQLAIGIIYRQHKLSHCSLEGQDFKLGVVEKPVIYRPFTKIFQLLFAIL
jgi:hypothetical protein